MKKTWSSETANAVREATGLQDPVQGAILLAEELSKDCGVTKGAEGLEMLASAMDARVSVCDLGKEAGQLVPPLNDVDPYLILVNEKHPRKRRNFSACHEIGHLLMPNYSPDRGVIRDWEAMRLNPMDEEEFLCDIVAAELLLPRREFKPRLKGEGLAINTVFALASEFDTSLEATLLHVVASCGADVAGIVWELDFDKKARMKAAHTSLDFGAEWEEPIEKKWRVVKSWTTGAMNEFFFTPRRSADSTSPTAEAGDHAAIGQARAVRDRQMLKPSCGDREFLVDSRGYCFRKEPQDIEMTTKVISLVWLNEVNT